MIKTIIFDWGGVLVENPTDKLIEYCANFLKVETDKFKTVFSKYEKAFQKGEIAEDELWNKICMELNVKKPEVESLWKDAIRKTFKNNIEVYNLVRLLKKKNYKTGFLSNTEIPAVEYFLENGYAKYFDATVFSCAENTLKPEKRIYQIALDRIGSKANESIFIDDKLKNVEGAKKIGINGIIFKNIKQLTKELESLSVDTDISKI